MDKPLENMGVVNLGVNVPAPVAAARLAGLGASVTKVEPPAGDLLASAAPAWYAALTARQEVLELNLKETAGHAQLFSLLEAADLLLTAQRPSALGRLGLDWAALHARFPRLCQVAIVGHASPNEEAPGHDLTYLAGLGMLQPPALPVTLVADLGGAERAVTAAVGLLLARERGQDAGYAEVALADAAAGYAEPLKHGLTRPEGILGGGFPAYGIYAARDGYIAVAALELGFVSRLLEGLGLPKATREALERAFRARTAAEWEAWGKEHDLPIAALRDVDP